MNNIFVKGVLGIALAFSMAFSANSAMRPREIDFISVTNSSGEVKLVPMTRVGEVRKICEVRDFSKIGQVDTSYDIYIHKLIPSLIVPTSTSTKLDVQDVGLRYISVANVDDSSDMSVGGKFGVTNMIVTVDSEVLSYLENLRRQTLYENKYDDNFITRAYLGDFNRLSDEMKIRWCRLFVDNSESYISFVKNPHHPKMISEVRLENNTFDKDLLVGNLETLKNMGYDSVLLRYDCSESISVLKDMFNTILDCGMKVYIVYVGLDVKPAIAWNPFIEPSVIVNFISEFAPRASGMFLNWRGTSAHVRLLPIEFFNFLCNTARRYNQNLPIYGEVYYGRIDYIHKKMLVKTLPRNVNGVVINNMGYYGYNHTYIVRRMFQKAVSNWSSLDKVGMVIGYQPYYASKHKIENFTFDEEYGYKRDVEKSFNAADCDFVTMLHDGVDDYLISNGTYQTNDNISKETNLNGRK